MARTTERSLSSYHDGEPVMLTHTVTRAQYLAPRRRYLGPRQSRTARTARPVRDLMAAAVPAGTSTAADWKSIMSAAKGQALGVGE